MVGNSAVEQQCEVWPVNEVTCQVSPNWAVSLELPAGSNNELSATITWARLIKRQELIVTEKLEGSGRSTSALGSWLPQWHHFLTVPFASTTAYCDWFCVMESKLEKLGHFKYPSETDPSSDLRYLLGTRFFYLSLIWRRDLLYTKREKSVPKPVKLRIILPLNSVCFPKYTNEQSLSTYQYYVLFI